MLPSDPGKQLISLDLELQRARSNRTQGVQSGPKWMAGLLIRKDFEAWSVKVEKSRGSSKTKRKPGLAMHNMYVL